MQPLLVIAILGGIAILGVGYLGNDILLMIQSWGVGEGDILSPVTRTDLTLQITRVNRPGGFDDFITRCDFTSLDDALPAGTNLFCKLYEGTNINTSNVFAEGTFTLPNAVPAGTPIQIPITIFVFPNSNDVDYIRNAAVLVQAPPA